MSFKGMVDNAEELGTQLHDKAYHKPCWVKTVGRGAGKAASKCDKNYKSDLLGLYCMKNCKKSYDSIGDTCYQSNCPDGFLDWGPSCSKPAF